MQLSVVYKKIRDKSSKQIAGEVVTVLFTFIYLFLFNYLVLTRVQNEGVSVSQIEWVVTIVVTLLSGAYAVWSSDTGQPEGEPEPESNFPDKVKSAFDHLRNLGICSALIYSGMLLTKIPQHYEFGIITIGMSFVLWAIASVSGLEQLSRGKFQSRVLEFIFLVVYVWLAVGFAAYFPLVRLVS